MKLIFQPSITQCILNYFKNLDIDPPKIKKRFQKSTNRYKSSEWKPEQGHTDILEHLDDGWVHEIIAWAVVKEGLDDGLEEEVSHDVAIVELVLQTDDPPHEAQGTWGQTEGS